MARSERGGTILRYSTAPLIIRKSSSHPTLDERVWESLTEGELYAGKLAGTKVGAFWLSLVYLAGDPTLEIYKVI